MKFCFEMSSLLLSWRYTYIYPGYIFLRLRSSVKTCFGYTPKKSLKSLEMLESPTALRVGSTANEPFYPTQEFPPGHNHRAEVGQTIITAANQLRLQQDNPAELWKCSLSLMCPQWPISWQQIRRWEGAPWCLCRRNNLQGDSLNNFSRS